MFFFLRVAGKRVIEQYKREVLDGLEMSTVSPGKTVASHWLTKSPETISVTNYCFSHREGENN